MSDGLEILRAAAELAIRYRTKVGDDLPEPCQLYSDLSEHFPADLPTDGMPAMDVIETLVRHAEPGLRPITGPRFFGWVMGGSHPVGVAADWLAAAWGQNAGNHFAGPAAAVAEAIAARWLLELLDLPATCSVGFVTGATMANFVSLAAARGEVLRRAEWDVEAQGLFGAPPISVLIGGEAHATVFSALQFLGLGQARVVRLPTDDQGQVLPEAAARVAGGLEGPAIVILQAGQINTGGFDPFPAIIAAARRVGAWVHVDGAFGLWARACPSRRHLTDGIDLADSWAVDGHKWLQVPYDCGYAIVRDPAAHRRAMTTVASYLPATHDGERDPSHFVPELSRRARGFATWAMIRHLGRNGIAEMVEQHCRIARAMADRLGAAEDVAVLNDVQLNQCLIRFGTDLPDDLADRLTAATIARIQAEGICFAGGARWRGQHVMRISVASKATTMQDGVRAADTILAAWRATRSD